MLIHVILLFATIHLSLATPLIIKCSNLVCMFKESWQYWTQGYLRLQQRYNCYIYPGIFWLGLKQVYTHLEGMRPHAVNTGWAMLALIRAEQVYRFHLTTWVVGCMDTKCTFVKDILCLIVTGWKRSSTTTSGS